MTPALALAPLRDVSLTTPPLPCTACDLARCGQMRRTLLSGVAPRWRAAATRPPCFRSVNVSSVLSPWHLGSVPLPSPKDSRQPQEWRPMLQALDAVAVTGSAPRQRAVVPDLIGWFILPETRRSLLQARLAEKPAAELAQEPPAAEKPPAVQQMGSTLKKRKSMMNKHKLKKRRKRDAMKKRVMAKK